MKVLVLNNMAPFQRGGAEELADTLTAKLNATHGISAELVRLPFTWDPAEKILDSILSCLTVQIDNVDRVIALKFPAYLVQHHHKTLWLLHQYRQAYDLQGTNLTNLPGDKRSQEIRNCIVAADNACFTSCQRIFVNSRVTQSRLSQHNGFKSEILLPPVTSAEDFHCRDYGDYIFAGGRINMMKRQHLLVEAMRFMPQGAKLIVAGPPESPSDGERLQQLIADHDLQDKVTLELGFLPRERLAAYVNGALACAYLPVDEDSVGYVTMESFYASKAVITCTDSGGVLDLVGDSQTGFVCEPAAEDIARAMSQMTSDPAKTRLMGGNAREAIMKIAPDWRNTIDRLLA
jgi:glycosyltransferase involved in cell wall biosynthesis